MSAAESFPTLPSGWHERMYRSFEAVLATTSGERLDLDGVCAAVSPAVPERSVFNSVLYERPEALADSLDRLADAYDEAGVDAWTVWVPESDRESARLLEAAGHTLDANPTAMVLDLDQLVDPGVGDLDWDDRAPLEEVCRINDRAYGYPDGTFARGLGDSPQGVRFYRARLDGEPASVVGATDLGGDCGIWWVATLPEARGHALAGRLMHVILSEARVRGCDVSTLEATKLGAPVYERLGYRDIGTLEMWERRR
jgi:GNAT superfamily N-acetyltransferase